jgi:hypothetical protein
MDRPPAFDEVRMQAWKILRQVEDSRTFADLSLDRTFAKNPHWRPLDRAFILELVLGTLRWRGRITQTTLRSGRTMVMVCPRSSANSWRSLPSLT